MTATTVAPSVRLDGVGKRWGDIVALDGASLDVAGGELHALVGENGAGKSTLMNVLYGLVRADEGSLAIDGADVDLSRWSPSRAIAGGVGMVHQHFMLVPTLSVAENVVLGSEPRTGLFGWRFDRARAEREVADVAARFGVDLDPRATVGDLSVGQEQRVEIVKLLYRGARLLILDEPTAVLTPPEVLQLFTVLRGMRDEGRTVIVVTHKLGEVKALCDRLTVLRRGRVTGTADVADVQPADMARMMVGRDVLLQVDKTVAAPRETRLVARGLEVDDDRGLPAVRGVDLELRAGEIVGLAGVEGNGQSELLLALTGLRRPRAGRIQVDGQDLHRAGVPARHEAGVAHIPEDRQRRGLVLPFSVADNGVLGRQREARFSRGRPARLDHDAIAAESARQIEAFDIRPPDPDAPASSLSGGNQQKIVVARELSREPSVLIAAQPTRGVDVGAIEAIHRRLIDERDRGVAVLLVSAELDEILGLADRVAVIYRGRLVACADRADVTRQQLGCWMAGQELPPREATP